MSDYQGIEDEYLPPVVKPSLQQYDNYQIYDLYCTDIYSIRIDVNGTTENVCTSNTNRLAVQAYNINPIPIDFNTVIKNYP